MFPSRKFCSFFFFLHHFHFECGAHFFLCFLFYFFLIFFFFAAAVCADQKSWKINFGFLAFLRVHSFVVFLFFRSVFRFWAAQQATRLFVFVFCFSLCCFVLFPPSHSHSLATICHPLVSPIFYITTPFIISFAKHSHSSCRPAPTPSPTRALFVFRHIPASLRASARAGLYLLYIHCAYYLLVSFRYMKLYVCAYRRQFSRSFNLIY